MDAFRIALIVGRLALIPVPFFPRPVDAAFNRAPGSATRFEAAFEIREYDADAALNIHGLSFSFAPTVL
jgi:hypothetical protein